METGYIRGGPQSAYSSTTECKKQLLRKRSTDTFTNLTNLMVVNQNLTQQISALKAEISETQSSITDLQTSLLCPCCREYDKAVVFSCRCIVCEGCAAGAVGMRVCVVCKLQSTPLCGLKV